MAVFINEFHYDNSGTDTGEFIEIAGTAGTNLSGYSLVLYNGNGNLSYNTLALTGTIPNQGNGNGTLSFAYPSNGIQNGNPDGIALVGPGNVVVEFISYGGVMTAGNGPAAGMTSVNVGVTESGSANGTSIARTGTGTQASDFTFVLDTNDTPGAINNAQTFTGGGGNAQVTINDVTIAEGNSGTRIASFTVTRSDNTGAFSVDFATSNGTATAGSDYVANSGTLSFTAGGALTQAVSVTINGDTASEPNETFNVMLSNLVNSTGTAAIADSLGVGTISNDEVTITRIHDIQGAAHTSPLNGQIVTTTGIVTAVDTNGFYLQEKDANIDASDATSEGIFVFTNSAPTVVVGQEVNVTGRAIDFFPGGVGTGNLSTTEIDQVSAITVLSSGNALPAAIVLGTGGRMAPTEVIDNDNFATFDPAQDGIDFYESLEGMRVTVPAPLVVAATTSFGEIFTVANNGANATSLNDRGVVIASGTVGDGLNVTNTGPGSDYNPERIQIDADSFTPGVIPTVNVGAVLNDVTGVLSYNFGNFEVLATSAVSVATPSTLLRETTSLTGSTTTVTISQYNVENLDPGDGAARFTSIADQIVDFLLAPDIIALQEVQDNDGATNSTTVSASITLQMLVDAITAAGGPTYNFIDNPFVVDDQVGGEPGGNIRVAYLYNAARVSLVGAVSTTPDAAADFAGSRVPLVATFDFAGDEFTLINNHFSSKGGGTPLFGATQPSVNGGANARLTQAQNVADYVASLDPATKVLVLGDLNEFTNEESLAPLNGVGLSALSLTLPEDEQYSYVFEGNAQELDQTYVSASVASIATLDIVHINAEFADQISDHDPAVIALTFPEANFETIGGITVYDEADGTLHGSTSTPVASNDVVLVRLGSVAGTPAGAESIAFEGGKAYSSNLNGNNIGVTTVTAQGTLVSETPIALSGLLNYKPGGVNGVAVKNGIIAVGYEHVTPGEAGYVALFSAADNSLIKVIQVGVLPDQVTFTPDGSKLLVANEAEALSTTVNPFGSVSIIDLSGGAAAATVTNTISFASLNGSEALLKAQGLALFAGQSAAADIEPEYITVSPDGSRAYVTLQEVNAVAVIDLTNPAADRPLAIQPIGTIDRNLDGNEFDGSDQDGAGTAGAIDIQNYDVLSLPQPDAIASFAVAGVTYFVTANEGDSRVGDGISDSVRLSSSNYVLDATAYPNAAALKDNDAIGRLNVLTNIGDTDGDGDFDQIYTLGGRGISIFKQEADGSITKVRETGGEFEAITAALIPGSFNSNQSLTGFDGRSDDKGPEPEGVSVGVVNGRTYAFVGLERVGGYMIYDVTDPANAAFVGYKPQTGADLGPETSAFVSAADSPTGQALLLSAQEVSNTVTLYSIQTQSEGDDTIIGGADADTFGARGGNDTIRGNGGNDIIDGGIGSDIAVFASTWVQAEVLNGGATVVTFTEGTDTLTNVETLQFAGVNVSATAAVNDAPIASDDTNASDAVAENGDGVAVGNVLFNDTDADLNLGLGETLNVFDVVGASGFGTPVGGATVVAGIYGDLTINPDGSYSYALDNARAATNALSTGQTVVDTFSYGVRDAHGLNDVGQLAISISGANDTFTLQVLHFSDTEAGLLASETAPFLAALVDAFEDDYANSVTVASGDLFLPGPFLAAGTDQSLKGVLNSVSGSTISSSPTVQIPIAAIDIQIVNEIGVELSAIGNHEFDLGSRVLRDAISPNLGAAGYVGANFAYLSSNLDFSGDADLNPRFTQTVGVGGLESAASLKGRIAPSAVLTEGGEKIGFVGATTQVLESISSPSGTEVKGFPFGPGPNGESNDMDLLAAQLQLTINDLISQGVNKIVLVSHLQQLQFEQLLATKLTGVDIIIGGGSNTRLGDADDTAVAFPGHDASFDGTYPLVTAGADGKTTLIVNTDSEFTYLGRLVVDFDANGDIILDSVTDNVPVNGAYASTAANVADAWGVAEADLGTTAFAPGTRGEQVKQLTDAVQNIIALKDGNIYGYSEVYLEGERATVRSQETNLGSVSADANANVAREALGLSDEAVVVSIKNGGGIRAQIGTIVNNPDGTVSKIAPEVGGEVSQLDVENSLRFDNKLMVFDTTAQGLLNILNSPNAVNKGNGGFIQIGGVQFSYDPTKPAGSRVQDVALVNALGEKTAIIADNGVVVANAPALIQAVVLNFTANGGDLYAIKPNAENFRFILNDGTLSAPVSELLDFTAAGVVPANAIGEQQAFAEFFQENFATPETAYDVADAPEAQDLRIQNQAVRTDTVLAGDFHLTGTENADVLTAAGGNDTIDALGGDDTVRGNGGNDAIDGGAGIDTAVFGGNFADYTATRTGTNVTLTGPDGTDTVINVENFQFGDGTRAVGQVGNVAPALTGAQAVLANGTEDFAYTVTAAQLLTGFTDANGDTLAVSGLTASNGQVIDNGDGSFTVRATYGFDQTMALSYDVIDGNGGTVAATQSFVVDRVADPAAVQGPSSTQTPYILGFEPNVHFTAIATVGDTIGVKSDGVTPYRMVGIPDGLGAYDNGDGTITLLMNHEIVGDTFNLSGTKIGNADGIVREHGAKGSFVSQWVIDKTTLQVVTAKDAITDVRLWDRFDTDGDGDANVDWLASAPFSISRLCSADLAPITAYQWTDTMGTADTSDDVVYGTAERIFLTGEEFSPVRDNPATPLVNEEVLGGREFALVTTGADAGTAFELAHFGYFAWENAISSPFAQKKTINISLDDGLGGQVYVYVGEKQTTGNAVEKAGLVGGDMYAIRALNLAGQANNESDAVGASGRFDMIAEGDISLLTGIQLDDLSEANGATSFLRPEDGQFDPTNPAVFWFVTTASFTGQSRLYKLTFDDITQPELGGTIEVALSSADLPDNSTTGPRMMDNMTVTANGKILIQEDVGNQAHLGRVLEYDPVTDTVTVLAQHDAQRFIAGLNPAEFRTQDEESSGIIDVSSILGDADTEVYLVDVQSHKSLRITDPELVEDGQLLLMSVDTPLLVGTEGDDTQLGSAANETFTGLGGNDTIRSGSGNDTITAGLGNDSVDGGAGIDTAVFGGNFADYTATRTGTNVTLTGPDGTDTVINVESFQFGDGSRTVGQVGNVAPTLTGAQAVLANGTEDFAYIVTRAQLLTGYTDANGDTLAVAGLVASNGTVLDNGNGSFTITPAANANGPVTLSYDVVDGNGGITPATLGFVIDPVNDAPSALALPANTVPENSPNGRVVGTLVPTDVDNASGFSFALLDNAGGRFAVNASTGVITVANGALLNFEVTQAYTIDARVTDAGGLSFNTQLTINVTNVAESQTFTGTSAADVFTAATDDNFIIDGKGGNDILTTLGGIDRVFGGGGNDIISLGGGNDLALMSGGGGFDAIDGGAGNDTILATRANTTIGLTSIANVELINAGGNAGVDIMGSSGGDMLDFSGTVLLGIGAINGGAGADTITGSAGADRILGGAGADILSGSGGEDVFALNTLSDSGIGVKADHILDFVSGVDKFDFTNLDADSTVAGKQAFTFIGTDAFTARGQLRIGTDASGHVTVFGNVTGNLNPDFSIVLDNNPVLVAADFMIENNPSRLPLGFVLNNDALLYSADFLL